MLLNTSYFEGEITIGQASEFAVSHELQWYIDKYEPIFFHAAIGEILYQELAESMQAETPDEKWTLLNDQITKYAAKFVWCKYVEDGNTVHAGIGVVQINSESATNKSAQPKFVRVWNEIVDNIPKVADWIINHGDVYETFDPDMNLYFENGLHRHENLYAI